MTDGTCPSPLVSIVLPTYNRAHLLGGAIASCLDQTHREIEIVVVDDGSTDDTATVVREAALADPRVCYLRQENQRLPAALNTGHRASRGDYLTWTSDDNRYDPDAIQIMVEHLERYPEFGLVYCDYRYVDERGESMEVRRLPGPEDHEKVPSMGACFLYRRSVYEAIGDYDTTTFLAEDYDYYIRISKRFKVVHLAGIAPYGYFRHGGALSTTMRPEVDIQGARIRAKYSDSAVERRRILGDGHFSASFGFRTRGQFRDSLKHGLLSVVYRPGTMKYYQNLIALGNDALRAAVKSTLRAGGSAPEQAPPAESTGG